MCPRQIGDNINDEQYKSASLFSVIKFIEFKNQPQYTIFCLSVSKPICVLGLQETLVLLWLLDRWPECQWRDPSWNINHNRALQSL